MSTKIGRRAVFLWSRSDLDAYLAEDKQNGKEQDDLLVSMTYSVKSALSSSPIKREMISIDELVGGADGSARKCSAKQISEEICDQIERQSEALGELSVDIARSNRHIMFRFLETSLNAISIKMTLVKNFKIEYFSSPKILSKHGTLWDVDFENFCMTRYSEKIFSLVICDDDCRRSFIKKSVMTRRNKIYQLIKRKFLDRMMNYSSKTSGGEKVPDARLQEEVKTSIKPQKPSFSILSFVHADIERSMCHEQLKQSLTSANFEIFDAIEITRRKIDLFSKMRVYYERSLQWWQIKKLAGLVEGIISSALQKFLGGKDWRVELLCSRIATLFYESSILIAGYRTDWIQAYKRTRFDVSFASDVDVPIMRMFVLTSKRLGVPVATYPHGGFLYYLPKDFYLADTCFVFGGIGSKIASRNESPKTRTIGKNVCKESPDLKPFIGDSSKSIVLLMSDETRWDRHYVNNVAREIHRLITGLRAVGLTNPVILKGHPQGDATVWMELLELIGDFATSYSNEKWASETLTSKALFIVFLSNPSTSLINLSTASLNPAIPAVVLSVAPDDVELVEPKEMIFEEVEAVVQVMYNIIIRNDNEERRKVLEFQDRFRECYFDRDVTPVESAVDELIHMANVRCGTR
jgi:hypothetical protein